MRVTQSQFSSKKLTLVVVCLMVSLLWNNDAEGRDLPESGKDLLHLSLEELLDIKVTSVAKKEQKLVDAAAAVFVITQEDIRRSGHTTIPELLRMVPGVEVAHIDANKWAITARGLNERFAKRLLVLIDGRSVYSPLFSGVYWDVQDMLLEDIDRIEVIRGPGGTLWGANAVNGVINIISKHAKDTQGGFLEAGAGSEEKGFGSLRYGGKVGGKTHYRGYVKYFNRDDFKNADDTDGSDEWKAARGGFRIDSELTHRDDLTLQGDYYDGESGVPSTALISLTSPFTEERLEDAKVSGGNLLARWKRTLSDTSDFELQFYYDRADREEKALSQTIDTMDLDFQHRLRSGDRHEIIWGLGQRFISDNLNDSLTTDAEPGTQLNLITSGFVQDEIDFPDQKLKLTVGSKFEWNSFSGFEAQPNVRLVWNPVEKHTLWTAFSRAVRTPSRFETDIRLNVSAFTAGPSTFVVSVLNNDSFESEELLAYELGYRFKPTDRSMLDIAFYYHDYNDLASSEKISSFTESSPLPSHTVLNPKFRGNLLDGEAFGVEVAGKMQLTDWWILHTAFNWMDLNLFLLPQSTDTSSADKENNSPDVQFNIRSQMNLPYDLEFDTALYFVDELSNLGVDAYTRLDARLGWKFSKDCDLSAIAQNLQDSTHLEFTGVTGLPSTEVERSGHLKLACKF